MLKYTQEELEKILKQEFDYKQDEAARTAEKLLHADPDLQDAFEQYLKDKTISSIDVGGFTIDYLMKQRSMYFPGAILTLAWLRREPEKAKKAILGGIM